MSTFRDRAFDGRLWPIRLLGPLGAEPGGTLRSPPGTGPQALLALLAFAPASR